MSVPDRKAQRTALRRLRRALPESLRRSWSQQIQEAAWRLLTDRGIFVLFAYWSVREEVQTDALMRRWLREGRTLVLARPDPSSKTMSLYRIAALEAVEPGPWGIAQPRQDLGAPVEPKTVQAALVPGLGFDASGNRLGSGAGFYDRFLSNWSHLWRVGLFFEAQRLERIEPAPWDVPLDVIITEERCLILHDWPEVLRKRGESALR